MTVCPFLFRISNFVEPKNYVLRLVIIGRLSTECAGFQGDD